ncbi:MAG: MG2 domain-containing protein [Archangium sp.]
MSVKRLLIGLAVLLVVVLGIASTQTCLRLGFRTGVWVNECPDGDVRQTISVSAPALKRGEPSSVTVAVNATYLVGPNDIRKTEQITSFTPTVALVNGTQETAISPKESWKKIGTALTAELALPKVNDGDYVLRVRATSPLGEEEVDLPLPLYTPARIHVLTDRPLYEPGNTVKFRAIALKANDLTPLEERPGTWVVTNSSGEVLLEEKAASGPWGVVVGSFPIDRGATSGEWNVTWRSGPNSQSRTFTVKPFTLPRFRLEASTLKPFYRRGERPVVKGSVKYSSGAPVANAKLELRWSVSGEWPAPISWTSGNALPKTASTSANGTFTVELPQVPEDLQGRSTLFANIGAVDASGDRVEGSAAVLLSQDLIAVSGITELQGGLVEGVNNRLFLRATTADGRLLDGVTLNVKRLWEPTDKGTDAVVDEDGVASLQIDPGPAVNVIIPAMPFRPPPPVKQVTRNQLSERLGYEEDVSLADRMAFDALDAKLTKCTRLVLDGNSYVEVSLLVTAAGKVAAATAPATPLGDCVKNVVASASFSAGKERFYTSGWNFDDSDLPALTMELDAAPDVPMGLEERLALALMEARDCLPATVKSGELPRLLRWEQKKQRIELTWANVSGDVYADSALSCITSRVKSFDLPKVAGEDEEVTSNASIGVAHLGITAPEKYESIKPQDTIMIGYEFLVTAKKGGEVLGTTKLRMTPGSVPPLRLRATSQLVKPGETVKIEVLRSADYTGDLPEKLWLRHAYDTIESKVDEASRSAQFQIPAGWSGWASVAYGSGQVFLFVQPASSLAVKVTPEKPTYAPGEVAHLEVETLLGTAGGPAAVGLFGVDESLSQLAALPNADELAGLRPQANGEQVFGAFDAQALSLGRIRGANATAATLVRVSSLPAPPEIEATVAVNGATVFDPNETQVDRFYVVLGELYGQVRTWETSAPKDEKLTPQTMAKLWNSALDAVTAKKESVNDAWGRRLRLHRLPADLLALTEPRAVIIDGTRLPEDMQNWSQWVAKEKP